jgi:hypothetical protein
MTDSPEEEASLDADVKAYRDDYIKELENALRQCHTALEVAFDYDDGDVFGIHHNDAVDAVIAAKNLLGEK